MNYDNFQRDFYRQLKADQKEKAATKQRLKIALIIGGIIICLMLMIS
jgi:CHASE3 domain sensor protein